MKKFFGVLSVAALMALTISSCNDSVDTNYEEQILKQEKEIDSILTLQKSRIQEYVDANFQNPIEDTVKVKYSVLDKAPTTRGIWYEVLAQPTDTTYEYKATSPSYQSLIAPTFKAKYTAKLLNGTVVQSDLEGKQYSFGSSNNNIFNYAWYFAFFPYSVKFNGYDVKVAGFGGLTKNGLKKGSKIKFVTPSLWGFGSSTVGEIPANSPLVYEIEVLEIQ